MCIFYKSVFNKNIMQYKIPVQIENEDPIFLGLSLKQLTIIMIFWSVAYLIFTSLAPQVWVEVAAIPSGIIAIIWIMIAIFKHSEMTFIPFLLSFIRFHTNVKTRKWIKWVDGFQPMDVWYISRDNWEKEEKIDFKSKMDKIKDIEDKLNKI